MSLLPAIPPFPLLCLDPSSTKIGWGTSGTQAFDWTSGTGLVGLPHIAGTDSFSAATAISDDGSVIAGLCVDASNNQEATFWPQPSDAIQELGYIPSTTQFGAVLAASANGSVLVGYSGSEAFRWTQAGGLVGLGYLSASGSPSSDARAISADGSVIAGYSTTANGTEAYRWTQATGMVSLGDLAGGTDDSKAFGMSADGSELVGFGTSANGQEAFIWDATNGMRSIRDILIADGINMDGWSLTEATAISADGTTVVGYGIDPQGQTEAWSAIVPEPATGSILLIAGAGMLMRRRRTQIARFNGKD